VAKKAQSDFIVAVVNSEPITNNQVRLEVARVLQQLAQQNRPQPDVQALANDVFDGLINRRIQLQFAAESGLKADNAAIDEAEQAIALQNQFDVAELRRRVVREGQTLKQFRTELGDQIVLHHPFGHWLPSSQEFSNRR
jgi:peptidyl-prolyl cis-trans isomerase SurA